MRENNVLKIGMVLIIMMLALSLISAIYTRSNVQYTQFMSSPVEASDNAMCEQGTDFLIQIAPFGCTPMIVRSDLLEEQNVPVFCQLGATQINPLIDVEAIETMSFSGEYPEEVEGIAFHPARAALGVGNNLNSPLLNNIGYVVIVLKQQANASAMPDFVSGNLTARVRYGVENAFGVGDVKFYLPELNDAEWEANKYRHSFWDGRGYLRAENIGADSAVISIYSDSGDKQVASVSLDEGEESREIFFPGFECLASLKLKLNSLENSDSRALLKINGNLIEVVRGEKFLNNKCEIVRLEKEGLKQEITISCKEDGKTSGLDLMLSPRVNLDIDGEKMEKDVGSFLYKEDTKYIYLAHVGARDNSKKSEDLFVFLVSKPNDEGEILSNSELSYYNAIVGKLLDEDFEGGVVDTGEDEQRMWIDYEEGIGKTFEGSEIVLNGFGIPVDMGIIEGNEDYENAMADYQVIEDSFASESYIDETAESFGEEELFRKIVLAWGTEQKATVVELCGEFENLYSDSGKVLEKYCDNDYELSNQESATNYITINGQTKKIVFRGIYEPSFADYGATVLVESSDELKPYELRKNKPVYISDESIMQLVSLEQDSAIIRITADGESKSLSLEEDVSESLSGFVFTLSEINLNNIAQISVISGVEDAGTDTEFGFKINIEKRNFELPPEKIREKIDLLENQIGKWQNVSDVMGTVTEKLNKACLATGAGLVLKNLLENAGGAGIARNYMMRGDGGWYEKCADMASANPLVSIDKCLLDKSEDIERDVDKLSEFINEQNERRKEIEKLEGVTETDMFGTDVVNINKFMEKKSSQVIEDLDSLGPSFPDPRGKGDDIEMDDMKKILAGWEDRSYNQEQLGKIGLYANVLNDGTISPELENLSRGELYSVFSDVKTNAGNYAEMKESAEGLGISLDKIRAYETENTKKIPYDGLTYGGISNVDLGGLSPETPLQIMQYQGGAYILVLDDTVGTNFPIKKDGEGNFLIYDMSGKLIEKPEEQVSELKDIYFQVYDKSSYENKYKHAELKYYETEPYKGMPAIVPFDLDNGWYVAVKQTLPILGNSGAYDESGAVVSFWVCNVGGNGLQESISEDDCTLINRRAGTPEDQISGLSKTESAKIVNNALTALKQAQGADKSGTVNILGRDIKIGAPAVDVPGIECQDFMSPKDCNLLFNVCDPVVCPSSRCDLGGAYPVRDVVQSGIIGSLALCFPNIREGIAIPVCLTGVKAGIDGWLSVKTSYRDCLQESLDTGEMVGICDEIYSVYMCEFFWRQALPLADITIPKVVGMLLGQNARGGGEYMTVVSAWNTAKESVNYFTNYYGTSSNKVFNARSMEQVGIDLICKNSISAVYPSGGDLLDTLTEPNSPVQFHGRFDEIPFTTATVPPISHYKVFYHIYAGENQGAYYQVYLTGIPGSSYYQDVSSTLMIASGYIGIGEYATETRDLTESAGYRQLCINVNGQEECGFKEVSTSFALDYITDKYVASQITDTDIKTENGCVSGTIFDQEATPGGYNYGIVRTCATGNPGIGSDPYAGTNKSRWKQVGYCGDEQIKCWLDTESVRGAIDFETIEENALEEVAGNYLDILKDEGGYLDEDKFSSKVKAINDEDDSHKKLDLIEEIFDKVFFNSEKAHVFLLRGNAYAKIAMIAIEDKLDEMKTSGECTSGDSTTYECTSVCPGEFVECNCVDEEWQCPQCADQCTDLKVDEEEFIEYLGKYEEFRDLFEEYSKGEYLPDGWTENRYKSLLVAIAIRQSNLGYPSPKEEYDPRWIMEFGRDYLEGCDEEGSVSDEEMIRCARVQIRGASSILKLALNKRTMENYEECNGKVDLPWINPNNHLKCVLSVYYTGDESGKTHAEETIEIMEYVEEEYFG